MSVLSSRSSSQVRSFSPFRAAPVRSNQSGNVYGNITVHNSQQPSSKFRTGKFSTLYSKIGKKMAKNLGFQKCLHHADSMYNVHTKISELNI